MLIKHKFVSEKPDSADPTRINASNWNEEHELVDPVEALSIASGVVEVDLSAADYFKLALSANVTSWSFINPPGSGQGFSKLIEITQHASAAKTMAMPVGRWDGAAPSISTTLGAVQVLSIVSFNNGTTLDLTLSGVRA